MSGFGTGFLRNFRGPVLALPVNCVCGGIAHTFPPHVAVIRECDVGENGITLQAAHAVGVGHHVGAGCHAKVARFWVDGAQTPLCIGLDPGDVITNSSDLPTLEAFWRNQHGEVRLAAGAGESGGHMVLLTLGVGDAQNQHVLRQPALCLAHG